jgi:hypothetical protein
MLDTNHGNTPFENLRVGNQCSYIGRESSQFHESHEILDQLWATLSDSTREVPLTGLPAGQDPRVSKILDLLITEPRILLDCHAFALSLLDQAGVRIPTVKLTLANCPNSEDFANAADYAKACFELCKSETPPEILEAREAYFESMFEQARIFEISLPETPYTQKTNSVLVPESEVRQLARSVCELVLGNTCSRHVVIWRDYVLNFAPVHSAILLGPTASSDDLWIVEKRGLAGPIVPNLLSNLIRGVCEFAPAWSYPKLAVSAKPPTNFIK